MIDFANIAAGRRVGGRYEIERCIGRGQSSAVYRARDTIAGTPVALKILDPFLAQDPVSVERFRREVQIVRALDHPHIIRIYDFFRDQGLYAICMEYAEGGDAKSLLRRGGPLALEVFLRIAEETLSALDACHRSGVLHRDLKPQNLLLDGRGAVRLADFGISKINSMSDLTKTGSVIGTPEYMAPELFRSSRADPRSDIYALGAVFYELLAGRPPYRGTSLASIMTQQLESEITPLCERRSELPPWLDAIVRRCLRLDADRRYQSPAEIETELRRAERALAVYEDRNDPAHCLACGEELVRGLCFCQDCGKFTDAVFEPGPYHVILYRSDEPALLHDYLRRFFPRLSPWRTALRLRFRPVVLFAGLSREAATGLYNELAASFCELGLAEKLPSEMRLPGWMSALGFALVPAFLVLAYQLLMALGLGDIRGGPVLTLALAGSPLASAAVLLALYRWKIRPLVSWRRARARAKAPPTGLALELVRELRQIHSRSTRRLLGGIAANCFAVRDLAARGGGPDPEAVAELLFAACRAARHLDLYDAYLSGRSLMGIKDELDRVEVRLARASDTAALEPLVKAKSDLAQELAEYRETEERRSRAHLLVLAAAGSLERLRNALQGREDCGGLESEIRGLVRDLDGCGAEPAPTSLNPGPGTDETPGSQRTLAGEVDS